MKPEFDRKILTTTNVFMLPAKPCCTRKTGAQYLEELLAVSNEAFQIFIRQTSQTPVSHRIQKHINIAGRLVMIEALFYYDPESGKASLSKYSREKLKDLDKYLNAFLN